MGAQMAGQDLSVRMCVPTDVDTLSRYEPPGAGIARSLIEQQESGSILYAAAWCGDVPLGSVVLDLSAELSPELKHLYVEDGSRGRGAGTALCAWAEEQASAAGFAVIYLGVGVDNNRARKLYQRLGYRPLGQSVTTTYNYVDDAGATQTATETDDLYVKDLRAR
jgi:ribosomal protein S18 acetylase RimI-like enzyme